MVREGNRGERFITDTQSFPPAITRLYSSPRNCPKQSHKYGNPNCFNQNCCNPNYVAIIIVAVVNVLQPFANEQILPHFCYQTNSIFVNEQILHHFCDWTNSPTFCGSKWTNYPAFFINLQIIQHFCEWTNYPTFCRMNKFSSIFVKFFYSEQHNTRLNMTFQNPTSHIVIIMSTKQSWHCDM